MVGDPGFATTLRETSMQDGKPLTVSVHDTAEGLLLRFRKARKGLGAEGAGPICQREGGVHFDVSEARSRLGPAANWLLRLGLAKGVRFELSAVSGDRLKISTTGWSGEFVPQLP